MGVGVYESDFNGQGGTFMVSGPLGVDDDYDAYVADCEAEGDEPLSRDDWAQEQYDDENMLLLDTIASAAEGLGLRKAKRDGFRSDAAPFDREFSVLADNGLVAVGWRSWQHDFVVAVGPTARAEEMLSFDAAEAAREMGRSPEGLASDYAAMADAVIEAMRISLIGSGMECRFRTSGYTSQAYSAPENPDGRIEELRKLVASMEDVLSAGRERALTRVSAAERIDVIRASLEAGDAVAFAVADRNSAGDGDGVNLYSGADADGEGCEIFASMMVPSELKDWFSTLPEGSYVAVPRIPETEAWFAARQLSPRERNVIASADEVAAAVGMDVSVRVHPESGDADQTTAICVASAPANSPSP